MRSAIFWGSVAAIAVASFVLTEVLSNEYYYYALYVILQGALMAIGWNILGGLTGYVNFGSAGFFALGVYTTVALNKALGLPLPLLILVAGVVGAVAGLGLGYLTLRLRGVYFAIATLAMAIVVETLINNWSYVGGARGSFILTPEEHLWFDSYVQMLFMVMMLLTLAAVAISRLLSA